jgi:predicted phosphodiesterase
MNNGTAAPIRLAVLADIHGVFPSLEQALDEILIDPPDAIVVAGDFVGGPQPHKTLSRLRELNSYFILGNGELRMLEMYRGTAPATWWSYQQFALNRWVYADLTAEDLAFIAGLPEQRRLAFGEADPIRMVHGTPWDVCELMYQEESPGMLTDALAAIEENILILGHIHQPGIYRRNGKLALNPGALSNNLNGNSGISYAILIWDGEAWQPELHPLQPDIDALRRTFIETGFMHATYPLGRALLESIATGEDVPLALLTAARRRGEDAGLDISEGVPDEIYRQVGETFPWKIDFDLGDDAGER